MGEEMKTPDVIKKGLECCMPRWVANHWKSCSSKCPYITLAASCRGQLVYDALAYIQQLEMRIPKWISMEERTPETGDLVLVIANGKPRENIELHNAILIASYWADEGWIVDGFDGWDGLAVSHWMPLPESPKEG